MILTLYLDIQLLLKSEQVTYPNAFGIQAISSSLASIFVLFGFFGVKFL